VYGYFSHNLNFRDGWHVFLIQVYTTRTGKTEMKMETQNNIMNKSSEDSKRLRKLIDIPESILDDLKKLATNSDKNLKSYIQDILITTVKNHRENSSQELERN